MLTTRAPIKETVERWRRQNFGATGAPFSPGDRSARFDLRFGRVAEWIYAQRDKEPHREDRREEDLYFPGVRARAYVRVQAWRGESPLGDMFNVVRVMRSRIYCSQEAAVAYVFAGVVPYTPPAEIDVERGSPFESMSLRPMTIRVNYDWVPIETVRWAYQDAQELAREDRMRAYDGRARPRSRPGTAQQRASLSSSSSSRRVRRCRGRGGTRSERASTPSGSTRVRGRCVASTRAP